jgi:hypothetical protein
MAREEPVTISEEIFDIMKSVDSIDDSCSRGHLLLYLNKEKKELNNDFHRLPKELCFLIAKYLNSSYMSLLRLSSISRQWYELIYDLPFSSFHLWQTTDLTIKAQKNYYQMINLTSKGRESEKISLFSSFSSPFPSLLSSSTACSSLSFFPTIISPPLQEEQYTFHRCFELKVNKPLEMMKLKYGRDDDIEEEEKEKENDGDFDYDSDNSNGSEEEEGESNEGGRQADIIHPTTLSFNQQKSLISSFKKEMIRKHQQFHYLWKISLFFHDLLCQFEQLFTIGTNYLIQRFLSFKNETSFVSKNVLYVVSIACFLALFILSFSASSSPFASATSLWLSKFFALLFFLSYGYYYLYLSFYELTSLIKNHLWFGSFSYVIYHLQWICIIMKYFLPLFYNAFFLLASSAVFSVLNSLGGGAWTVLMKPAWNEICSSIAVYYHNFSFFHMLIIFIINTPPSLLMMFGAGGGGNGGNGGGNVGGGLGIGGMLLAGIFGNNNNNNQNNQNNIQLQQQQQQPQPQPQPQFPPQFQDLNIFNNNHENNGFLQQQQPVPFIPPIVFGGGGGGGGAGAAGAGGDNHHQNPNSTLSKTIQLLIPFILQKVLNAFLIYPLTVYVNHRYDEIPSSSSSASSSSSSLEWLFYVLLLRFLLPIIHWFKILLILQMITIFYSFYTKYSITPYQLLEDGDDDNDCDEEITAGVMDGGNGGNGGRRRKFWKTLGKELYWWLKYLWFPFPKPTSFSSSTSCVEATDANTISGGIVVDSVDSVSADDVLSASVTIPFSLDLSADDSSDDEIKETKYQKQSKSISEDPIVDKMKDKVFTSFQQQHGNNSQSQYYHQLYSLFLQFGLLFFIIIQQTIRNDITTSLSTAVSTTDGGTSISNTISGKGGFNVERIVFIYLLLEILSMKTLQRLRKKIISNEYYLQKANLSTLSSSSIDWINILMMGGFGGGAGGGVGAVPNQQQL